MRRVQHFAAAKRVFAVLATTLLFAGCEGLFPGFGPEGEQITITATTENTISRTTLNASDEVVWQKDDGFVLYDMATGLEIESYFISGGVGTTSGSFTGEQPAWEGPSWAYYGDLAHGVGQAKIPATQKYVEGGFAVNVNPMVAVCDNIDNGVQFKNAAGIIELQISGSQELASIEVSAKEYLSGYYDIDQTTFEKSDSQWAVSSGGNVTLTDINVQLDAQNAKSFKVVVMPGTYTEFTVKMTNVDGSVVTKTAEEAIVVERSKITPIEGLVDDAEPVEKPKYVNLQFVEEDTNWHHIHIKTQIATDVINQVLYMWGTDEFINEWMSTNPNKTILDMMIAEGGIYTEDFEFSYNVAPNTTYNFYAVGLFVNESQETYVVGDVEHIKHTPEIPYAENATLSLSVPEATLKENLAVVNIAPSTSFAKVYTSIYSAQVDTNNEESVIFRTVVLQPGRIQENVNAPFDVTFENLYPETQYVVYAIGETAEGKLTHLTKTFFTTPAHVAASVTATAEAVEVKDWTADFKITLSEGAVGWKYALFFKTAVDVNPNVNWADEVASYDTYIPSDDTDLRCNNLTASSHYTLITIAYDADGSYGEASMLNFTTSDLIADYNAVGYNEMLGQWAVSYTDDKGQQMTDQFTITFTELFPGKLYTVKGLGGQGLGPTFDDSVQVRFNGEGKPLTMSSGRVLNGGQYEEAYDIYFRLVDTQYIYTSAPEFFDKGDGTYGIGASINPSYGVALGAYAKSNGAFAGTLGTFYNMTMRKIEQSSSSTSTEKFSRQETVSPTWKSVQPLRLNRSRFTPANR